MTRWLGQWGQRPSPEKMAATRARCVERWAAVCWSSMAAIKVAGVGSSSDANQAQRAPRPGTSRRWSGMFGHARHGGGTATRTSRPTWAPRRPAERPPQPQRPRGYFENTPIGGGSRGYFPEAAKYPPPEIPPQIPPHTHTGALGVRPVRNIGARGSTRMGKVLLRAPPSFSRRAKLGDNISFVRPFCVSKWRLQSTWPVLVPSGGLWRTRRNSRPGESRGRKTNKILSPNFVLWGKRAGVPSGK
jgi:hypothetical protein